MIAEKPRAEYTAQIGHRPAPSAVASWQNSLMALSMLVDAMLTGHSPTSTEALTPSAAHTTASTLMLRRAFSQG